MPRKRSFEYSLHRSSGQACVRIEGKVKYLGKYGTLESRVRHQNLVAAAQAHRTTIDLMRPISVGELAERYLAAMRIEYGPTSWQAVEGRRIALGVCERFAGLEAVAFGPKALQEVQQTLLSRGRICRTGVNRMVRRTAAVFKWAVSEELLPPSVWQALQSVRPLRRGKGRDTAPRMAVPAAASSRTAVVFRRRCPQCRSDPADRRPRASPPSAVDRTRASAVVERFPVRWIAHS